MMESETKDAEDDHLQTAFKKLRVDAEGSTAHLCVGEGGQQTVVRAAAEEVKAKLCTSKESWHGSIRKTSRGTARNQRRRRSKSPVLHPPRFTHCSAKMSACSTQLKHKSQSEMPDDGLGLCTSGQHEFCGSEQCNSAPSVTVCRKFGIEPSGPSSADPVLENSTIPSALEESQKASNPLDFRSVSTLAEARKCPCNSKECRCKPWQDLEVYSFSGLRNMISECEKTSLQNRTQNSSTGMSGSPRSCSEQARASVDDVTIEDLAGYMEYYLYIPKKMSHMAEMMYT